MKNTSYITGFLLIVFVILLSSCRNDFEFDLSSGELRFDRDTIYMDTVFTNIGSSTYNLKVYNNSNEPIIIPTVGLAQGQNSNYRLNVDGVPGKIFENVEIFAKDSIFIFVETTLDIMDFAATNDQFLYTDQLLFDSGANEQKVEIVTLVQDAVFLFPERFQDGTNETLLLGVDGEGEEIRIDGFFLDDAELNFTNDKPYVVYGYAAVPSNKTMTVDAGARLHFHANSGIIVASDGTLKVNGAPSMDPDLLENEVIFEGDRLEPEFSDVPGQWGTIWLTDGSKEHVFNHATIKNASVGIIMDNNADPVNPTLILNNTQIYNSANFGIRARTAHIEAENLVINNSGQISLLAQLGGKYNFTHCTLANYWNSSFRNTPSVLLSNALLSGDTLFLSELEEANFTNCIIYGNERREIGLDEQDGAPFAFNFTNSLIRFEDPQNNFDGIPRYDFTNSTLYTNTIFNSDPDFLDAFENKMNIGDDSAGNGTATSSSVLMDILGTMRGASPDIGAYESVLFPE